MDKSLESSSISESLRPLYLKAALNTATEEENDIFEIREFYEGRQLSDNLDARQKFISTSVFDLLKKYPIFNLVHRTVKVINERLAVDSITCKENDLKAETAQKWWAENDLNSWQSDIYEAALRDKACVVIVGWDGINKVPTFTLNELWDGQGGGTCRIHYDTNGYISFISKRWSIYTPDGLPTGQMRLTLYFDDRIERYLMEVGGDSPNLMTKEQLAAEDPFITENPEYLRDSDGNPLGIPAVVFENKGYVSECADAMVSQAGVNEAILDWHTVSRYHGMPTVIFKGVQFRIDPITGKPIEPEWSPGKGIAVDSGDVIRINAADVKSIYEGSVKPWIEIITRAKGWPEHVFTQIPPSGETIRQMEGSLVAQCDAKKTMFTDSWRDAFEIAFNFLRIYGKQDLVGELNFWWKSSLSISEKYDLQLLALKKSVLGLPQKIVLQEQGYSEEEIAEILKEVEAEKLRNATNLETNTGQNRLNDTGNPAGARGIIGQRSNNTQTTGN